MDLLKPIDYMLSITQYDYFLERQYYDVENKARKISIFLSPKFIFKRFFVKRAIRKTTNFMSKQLFQMKGLLSDLENRAETLKGKDLSNLVKDVERLIAVVIKLKGDVDEALPRLVKGMPETAVWETLLSESIDTLYATIRLLKRLNHKTPKDTSPLARESSKRSLTSLERVFYDRRTT